MSNIYGLKDQITKLKSIKLEELPDIARMTVAPVISDFIKRFGVSQSDSELQFKLASWHAAKHRYAAAYLALVESIITYVCEKNNLNYFDPNERNLAKGKIQNDSEYDYLKTIYRDTNNVRKAIAHTLQSDEGMVMNNKYYIENLIQNIKKLKSIYAD